MTWHLSAQQGKTPNVVNNHVVQHLCQYIALAIRIKLRLCSDITFLVENRIQPS